MVRKLRGELARSDDLRTTGVWKQLVLEMIVYGIHPVPFLLNSTYEEWNFNYKVTLEYFVNDIFLAWMIIARTILLMRYILG